MRVCVVEQQPDAPAGVLNAWAAERGHRLEVLRAPSAATWPDPRAFDAVVALGSDRSVHASRDAWIATEVAFLRAAHDAGVPVLGLCFGAQALAAALGGSVHRAPRVEIGWIELRASPAGEAVTALAPGPWFAWHEDGFSVPPGAVALARTAVGPQAFVLGASVGLQFHPEVDTAIVDGWVADGRRQLVTERIDEHELLAETGREAPAAGRRAIALFDAVLPRPGPSVQSGSENRGR